MNDGAASEQTLATSSNEKPLGFWTCWSLVVGCMIGSGVFMVPTVLAPYGLLSFGGWLISGAGAIALALVFGRLAARTKRNGGPYVYVQEAFGDLPAFMVAWGYWTGYILAIPALAIAFVGYLGVFFPAIAASATAQALSALGLIAALTLVNVRGLKEMSVVQIAMTLLKILPLIAIMGASPFVGDAANLPPFNPSGAAPFVALAAVTLITLWPFTGFEIATLPAGAVHQPERTIPRALVAGVIAVTVIYLGATAAVMLMVPADTLAQSTAPFADAARVLGPWGPMFISAGALVAIVGTLNGIIFTCGQMPMAVAIDKLAPAWLAKTNRGGAPHLAVLLSSTLGSVLLLLNYSRGLIGALTFLILMSTAVTLIYYFACAAAEVRHSWRSAKGWFAIAMIGCAYTLFAAFGTGLEILMWGIVLMVAGVPLFFVLRHPGRTPTVVAPRP